MNDWISRKDAINIIQSWLDSDIGYSEGERNVMGCAIEELKNLPPAKCLANDRYAEGLRDGAIIERKVTERWISVKDQLPEEYGEYLITWITSQSKRPFIAICECEISNTYNHEKNRFDVVWLLDDYIKAYPDVEVIAWQPLPEPAKVGDEE